MKKTLFLSLLAICTVAGTAVAQDGAKPAQQQEMDKAPNARAKETVIKLQTELNVTNEQGARVYAIFENFYTQTQKLRDEMRASGQAPDREVMKAKRDEMVTARDLQLKQVFTADQYTKWKDVVEPAMRPQRKGDGNGRP